MKRIVLAFLLLATCFAGSAQHLNLKSVNLRQNDARARTNPRDDLKGNKCAIIRVGVVGVDDLEFPDSVGNVEHVMNEYIVYVTHGLKKFRYKNKTGEYQGTVDFDDWGLEVNSLNSYDVVFETDSHMRAAIFSIIPSNAKLVFNNQRVKLDENGMAIVNMPPGKYDYIVEANGYRTASGIVSLTEDDMSTTTLVSLEQKIHQVELVVNPVTASLFVDNEPTKDNILNLSEGKHVIRITAPNYEEIEKTITVDKDLIEYYTLEKAKVEILKHKEERGRTSISVRGANYINIGFAMLGVPNFNEIFSKNNAWDFNLEYSSTYHFAGIMGVRFGLGAGFIKSNENEKYVELAYNPDIDSLQWLFHADIPLQLGLSLPLGNHNQHLFSVYGGGYGRLLLNVSGLKESYLDPNNDLVKDLNKEEKDDSKIDYGIRLSAMIDFGHFSVGAVLNQSLNDMGFSAGVNIGWKFYRKKKE